MAATITEFGRIDSLVNAAGLTTRGTLLDSTPELFDAHIAVNLKAPFFLMQAVVASLVSRKAPGTIVNIISAAEHAGQPYLAPYVAAKAGLAGLTRNAAHAHRWDRIRINGLNIGWTQTEGEDARQQAQQAVLLAVDRLESGRSAPREIVLTPHLVVRSTTAPPADSA